ncbi:MAG: hypothetical protein U0271_24870 [Polyangiaceae bacterium]
MTASWTLWNMGETIVLRHVVGASRGSRNRLASRSELEAWLGGPERRQLLVEIGRAVRALDPTHTRSQELVAEIHAAIERGELEVERRPAARHVGVGAPVPEPEFAMPSRRRDREEEKTWIAIRLVDDADPPKPVPFRRYIIELPDGSTHEGNLDGNGMARVSGIDPGKCRVTFPDLDPKSWARA